MSSPKLPSIDDLGALDGVRLFVRVDFNVPLENGRVADDARLEAALPTLRELAAAGARLVLGSHCGRPGGERKMEYSLQPVAQRLGELLDRRIGFADVAVGEPAQEAVAELEPGGICLLENLRFYPGETDNDSRFARQLAELADGFVCDAFGTVHRAHASVVGLPALLPRRAAGRLLMREVETLSSLLGEPAEPFVGLVGGAKVSGKIEAIQNLLPRLNMLALGGGMANTFLAALGLETADSMVEADRLETARAVLEQAARQKVEVVLPADVVVTDDLDTPQRVETVPVTAIPSGTLAVDIGESSRERIATVVESAGTIFWNGPMGVFETPPFDAGTVAVAEAVASSRAYSVIGGGETVAAVRRARAIDRIDHVSTGGGASLEFLAGKELPGIRALEVVS